MYSHHPKFVTQFDVVLKVFDGVKFFVGEGLLDHHKGVHIVFKIVSNGYIFLDLEMLIPFSSLE